MTDQPTTQQLRRMIAEMEGYKPIDTPHPIIFEKDGAYYTSNGRPNQLPDYTNDLNAIMPVVRRIFNDTRPQFGTFLVELKKIVGADEVTSLLNATPEQICRAVVRVIQSK